ncbi:MAG: hypothetical protein AAF899_12415, partial [Pseudomonadota bacterium]
RCAQGRAFRCLLGDPAEGRGPSPPFSTILDEPADGRSLCWQSILMGPYEDGHWPEDPKRDRPRADLRTE